MDQPIADIPARDFNQRIADPQVFSGGGSVAAMAAAGAASTALLVMRLNVRRRAHADRRDEIQAVIDRTLEDIGAFYRAADTDIETLDRLLTAQRELKQGGDQDAYLDALVHAAQSPLALAERILDLLGAIETQLPIASRFTISDLGAAAVLAEGACRAALLTAEVNVALLADAGTRPELVRSFEQRRAAVYERVIVAAETIERVTRARIYRQPAGGEARR